MVRKKSTILRQIKAGKLSATRHDNGQWKIEPAELARVHGAVATEGSGAAADLGWIEIPPRNEPDLILNNPV